MYRDNDPHDEKLDIPDHKGRVLSKLALVGVGILGACELTNLIYTFTTQCFNENISWMLIDGKPATLIDCAVQTSHWLPAMLRHLTK